MSGGFELGVSAIPAVLFLVTLFFIPRSPRWLLTQSRDIEAVRILALTGVPDAQKERDEIVRSLQEEGTGASDSLMAKKYRLPVILAITVGMFCTADRHQRSALLSQ